MNKLADEVFFENLKDEINFNKRGYEITNERIAKILGCHINTVSKKLQHPELFTLVEIKQLARLLKVKRSTLIAYIYGDVNG